MSTFRAHDLRLGSQRISEAVAAIHRATGVETKDGAGDAAAGAVIRILSQASEVLDTLIVGTEHEDAA